MTSAIATKHCSFCGRPTRSATGVCPSHADLPATELTLFNTICTETEDCAAEPDAHTDACPVEKQLRDDLGF